MSCAACQARVEKAVSGVPGVESCSVSLLTYSMSVEGTADAAEIIKAVERAGYGARLRKSEATEDILKDTETPKLRKRLIISVALLLALMYFSMGVTMWGWPGAGEAGDADGLTAAMIGIIEMILAGVIMYINRAFFTNGFKGLMHGAPNMDTLVAMGSGVSFLWSAWVLFYEIIFYGNGAISVSIYDDLQMASLHKLYFESAAMIVTLITVGKLLEAMAKGKTTDALKSLMKLAPQTVTVFEDGTEKTVPIEEVRAGDIFIVKPGDNVPVDGVIIEGATSVNESALTGESVPVNKEPGDQISAATLNQYGSIKAKATRVGEDTTLSQIIKMVSDAAATKAPIARIADKVSGIFIPAVLVIALIVIIIWLIAGAEAGYALARGISVLVVSCPCALGLATPVAIMVGNGVGAKNGILFKTAQSQEETGRVTTVVLDKTGTITEGRLEGGDVIREESPEAIRQLRNMGIRTVMLSGDKEHIARAIGKQVGVDEIIAGVKPEGKERVIKELQKSGKVAMVGDGINDAPALTRADVGIAIGAGTDVAIDAADVVLMNSRLTEVPAAIRLSRATLRNIHENLFWAFIYNIVLIPVAAGAFVHLTGWTMNPMLGAAAMSVSSFCVCMNALRLNLFDIHSTRRDREKVAKPAANIQTDTTDTEAETDTETTEEKQMEKTMNIEGMMCMHCEATVKKALEEIDGVEAAQVSHEQDRAVVTLNADVADKVLKEAVEAKDYKVISIE